MSARGLLLGLFLALCAVSIATAPARANNTRPDVVGTHLGSADVSAGTAWTSLTSASLRCATTAATCPSGLTLSTVTVINTHASQVLYLQLKAGGVTDSVSNAIAIGAGDSLSIDVYGMRVTAVSLYGSGPSTTGRVIAHLLPN